MKGRTINAGYVIARQLERIISLDTKQQCLEAKNIPVDYVNTRQHSHKQSKHEGKIYWYPFDSCDYQAPYIGNLTTHKQTMHEGKKYPCNSYQATQRGQLTIQNTKARNIPVTLVSIRQLERIISLNTRQQFMKARNIPVTLVIIKQLETAAGSLTMHNQSKHEGKKYPCDSCEDQATPSGSLNFHN